MLTKIHYLRALRDDLINSKKTKKNIFLQVDLDSKLGKSQVITKTTPASQQGG